MSTQRTVVAGLATILLSACGSSGSVDAGGSGGGNTVIGTAPVSAKSGCALAAYPSVQWTLCETQNLAVSQENLAQNTALLPAVAAATVAYQQARLSALSADPERQPNPNTCTTVAACPIDPRLQQWPDADGIVQPVLFTSRSGASLSGHVWATRSGPAKRPGVVIINGSGIGYEQIYWYGAQTLAKAGFLVLTFDVQGEGMSDQFGESPDQREDAFAGLPYIGFLGPPPPTGPGLGGNGLPFYDGGTDALDFFLSTPDHPYVPVPSRTSGTSHAAKQQRRVAAGLNAGYNPLWNLLDASEIGLAGHSYGAVAASWLAQSDPRISAAVAWDALCVPTWPTLDEFNAFTFAPINQIGGVPLPFVLDYGFNADCFGAPQGPAPALTKPALSITSDYFLLPLPYAAPPQPGDKSGASQTYSKAGVDTGAIVIRGATHLDFNDAPAPVLPYSLRGQDIVTWYTAAWFSKYLQHNPDADRMLLSARWRDDATEGAHDPAGDPNAYSWHYLSRLDVKLASGNRFQCENLREGCAGQYTPSEDCGPADYSFVGVANAPGIGPPALCAAAR